MESLAKKLKDAGFSTDNQYGIFNYNNVRVYFDDGSLVIVEYTDNQCIKSESRISLTLGEETVMQIVMAISNKEENK